MKSRASYSVPSALVCGCGMVRQNAHQEKETERGNLPLHPLKEKGKEKEANYNTARAGETSTTLPAAINIHTPPSLELLLAYAHGRLGFFDDDFTRKWWHTMNDELMWCSQNGTPIRNWPGYFRIWRANRRFFEALRDPLRLCRTAAERKVAEAEAIRRRREEAEERRRAATAATPEGWALCAERCAHFVGGGCRAGVRVPPAHQARPVPPEECPLYASACEAQEGGAI